MDRRNMFRAGLAAAASVLAFKGVRSAAAAETSAAKVAYHLSELAKVEFVLGNIENHIEGVGGADRVTIVLVVHGPALKAFKAAGVEPQVSKRVAGFSAAGVGFHACGNTMRAQKLGLEDLLPGFVVADKGGVVRLAELQAQGYAYLRP